MSVDQNAIRWMRKNLGGAIDAALEGTPFSANLVIAIALQETGFICIPAVRAALRAEGERRKS